MAAASQLLMLQEIVARSPTVTQDSYAEQWCAENNMYYTYPNANDWLLN